jgi:hypothetical protein
MPMGTEKVNKRAAREDKGTPAQELRASRAKSSERPKSANMAHVNKAAEHMKMAEHHHKMAKVCMSKCNK